MTGTATRVRVDIERAVLLAPLQMPTTKWSSRSVARVLEVSQSRVARSWAPMRCDTRVTRELAALAGVDAVGIVGLLLRPEYSLLVLQLGPARDDVEPPAGAFATPSVVRSVRTILAAELARDRVPEAAPSSKDSFWSAVAALAEGGGRYVAVASRPALVPGWLPAVVCDGTDEWLSLSAFLGGARRHLGTARTHAIENALRQWFLDPGGDLACVADSATPVPGTMATAGRHVVRNPGPERALADQIVFTIRTAVTDGRLAGGDRVTERYLAARLHTSRAQIRSAMRLLERDGLLTIATGHAAVIPVPDVTDVTETYAARQALGSMMVRAAVHWTIDERAAVEAALELVRRHAQAGDVYLTGQADTTFQDRIADASGLVRIANVMHILADHLRVFIAVMGLDYAYPVDAILRDDEAIHAALVAQDADLAVDLWRQKMANARTYMVDRLPAAHRRPGAGR